MMRRYIANFIYCHHIAGKEQSYTLMPTARTTIARATSSANTSKHLGVDFTCYRQREPLSRRIELAEAEARQYPSPLPVRYATDFSQPRDAQTFVSRSHITNFSHTLVNFEWPRINALILSCKIMLYHNIEAAYIHIFNGQVSAARILCTASFLIYLSTPA